MFLYFTKLNLKYLQTMPGVHDGPEIFFNEDGYNLVNPFIFGVQMLCMKPIIRTVQYTVLGCVVHTQRVPSIMFIYQDVDCTTKPVI